MLTESYFSSVNVEDLIDFINSSFFSLSDSDECPNSCLICVEGFLFEFPLLVVFFFPFSLLLSSFLFHSFFIFQTLLSNDFDVLNVLIIILRRFYPFLCPPILENSLIDISVTKRILLLGVPQLRFYKSTPYQVLLKNFLSLPLFIALRWVTSWRWTSFPLLVFRFLFSFTFPIVLCRRVLKGIIIQLFSGKRIISWIPLSSFIFLLVRSRSGTRIRFSVSNSFTHIF